MAKSIEPISLFAKSMDNDFFVSQEEFEKSLRLFIKIVMLSEFNPLSISCNYSKKNAIVTVKNLKDATEFIENYKRLPKPEFYFEILPKTPVNNMPNNFMQPSDLNNMPMPFNSRINPIQPTEKVMNRNNLDDPLVNMIDMMNINKNSNINSNENNNNININKNNEQQNNKEYLNFQMLPERENINNNMMMKNVNQMGNYNNNNNFIGIGNIMEIQQQQQFLQNKELNNQIRNQGIPGINQIPMNYTPQNIQIPQKNNMIMNQTIPMNNMNSMNQINNNIQNKFNQGNQMVPINHLMNINQMNQIGIMNPMNINPNEINKFGQMQIPHPNIIGNNNFIPSNLPQINSIGVINPMPNIGIPGINHINEMNGFPINNMNPYLQQPNINENRFQPNHNSIPQLFNNQLFHTGPPHIIENEKLVFNQNEKNSNIGSRVELNFNEERLKELNSEELSNEIFELVTQVHEKEACKITGMISELGESQMRHLLLNPLELKDTINHAYKVRYIYI